MKIILRVLAILLAAAVVIGAAAVVTQSPTVQAMLTPARPAGMEMASGAPATGQFDATQFATTTDSGQTSSATTTDDTATDVQSFAPPAGGHEGHESGGSIAGLAEVVKNLGVVLVVSLMIGIPSWLLQRQRRSVALRVVKV